MTLIRRHRYSTKVTDDPPSDDPRETAGELETLQAEIDRLRAEIARLQRQNGELLKSIIDRDYERPPHYR